MSADSKYYERKIQIDTLLQQKFPAFFTQWHAQKYLDVCRMHSIEPLGNAGDEKLEASMRSNASWRHVLVAQPPIHKLHVWIVEGFFDVQWHTQKHLDIY